jgi:hypothetical protein
VEVVGVGHLDKVAKGGHHLDIISSPNNMTNFKDNRTLDILAKAKEGGYAVLAQVV